ncbi:MAG: HD domain-containing protein [Terrimicrobiaceae bacterium]|nr:HD domain-containing protein [Terrimicrobiaceae bacterium]
MPDARRKTISEIRQETKSGSLTARLHGQIEDLTKKESTTGKPYYELRLRDGTDSLLLRAWSDTPAFDQCCDAGSGDPVEIEGEFLVNGSFGLEARRWRFRPLTPDETAALFQGSEEARAAADRDFESVTTLVGSIADPRLRGVCELFLAEFGARFRRAAAARFNHHAHRGGLLRHTAQMMRSAAAVADAYPLLNRDLLLAGVLFHDSGKLWEMCPPENGFEMPRELRGELLGHISIGIELANALWRKLPLEDWKELALPSEDVRLHLLHLIAAHHGELQFGSPVEPKTPEAIALHFIDNLDARLEMIFTAYDKNPEIAPGVFERVRALNASPVRPLASTPSPDAAKPEA